MSYLWIVVPGPVSWSNNYRGFLRQPGPSSTPAPAAALSRTSKIPPGPRASARGLGLRVPPRRRQQWPVDKVATLPALIFAHRRQMGEALSPDSEVTPVRGSAVRRMRPVATPSRNSAGRAHWRRVLSVQSQCGRNFCSPLFGVSFFRLHRAIRLGVSDSESGRWRDPWCTQITTQP